MGLIEMLLIIVGAIAVILALITIVHRASRYYRERYNISIWSGVLLLLFTIVTGGFAFTHFDTPSIPLIIVAVILFVLTAFLDVRHAGFGMGFLALLLQAFLSASFVLVIAVSVIAFAFRSIRRGDDLFMDALTGTTSGFRNGVFLFFRFFMP